jgi:predicted nicotinamide N-methyase
MLQANNGEKYDVVLAAECLWRHECHESLVQSIKNVLRIGGKAFITFSNHIPGLEKDDFMFFDIASRYGLETIEKNSFQAPHMWSDRMATLYLYTLQLIQ